MKASNASFNEQQIMHIFSQIIGCFVEINFSILPYICLEHILIVNRLKPESMAKDSKNSTQILTNKLLDMLIFSLHIPQIIQSWATSWISPPPVKSRTPSSASVSQPQTMRHTRGRTRTQILIKTKEAGTTSLGGPLAFHTTKGGVKREEGS